MRNSNIELFCLLLMVLILVHHSLIYGIGLGSIGNIPGISLIITDIEMPLYLFINAFTVVSVNSFLLISGYYGITPTFSKVKNLFLIVCFYTILFTTFYHLYNHEYKDVISSLMLVSHSRYYFIFDYFLLMAFAPMLNWFYDTFNERNINIFTSVLLICTCYIGFFFPNYSLNDTGYSIFQFITMYCIGRYLRRKQFCKYTTRKSISIYVILCTINAILMINCYKSGNNSIVWHLGNYNNPLVILASVSIFAFFLNLDFSNRHINTLSKSAIAIYLFQESTFVKNILTGGIRYCYIEKVSMGGVILIILIVLIALVIDKIRRALFTYFKIV